MDQARGVINEALQQLRVIGENERADIKDSVTKKILQVKKLEGVDQTTVTDLRLK